MTVRTTLSRVARKAQMSLSRATTREFDDNHLIQRIKTADVYHSESPSDFERWQMVGITSMPLKQEEEKQSSSKQQQTQADWNHNQPKGKSAEAVMLYLGGSRSLPIGIVDDPRVRPYALKEGESAMYAASGTGQMLLHNDAGSYLIAVNNSAEQAKDSNDKERFASLRHVEKKKQSREIKKDQKIDEPHHEGETVNLEVRATKTRIEFRAGNDVVGYYDKAGKKWVFIGEIHLGSEDANHPVYGKNTDTGKGQITKDSGDGAVLIKAPNPGPPTSLDVQP